jgi:hypothetical protein
LTSTRQLDELDLGDVATAGRKAANLGALARRGLGQHGRMFGRRVAGVSGWM